MPGALHARKGQGVVRVCFATTPGRLHTLEGVVAYAAGDALVTGTHGESWPVGRIHFDAVYVPCPPLRMGEDGEYARRPVEVWAVRVAEDFCLRLSAAPAREGEAASRENAAAESALLHGKAGDWLVQHHTGHYSVVREDIFDSMYECETSNE